MFFKECASTHFSWRLETAILKSVEVAHSMVFTEGAGSKFCEYEVWIAGAGSRFVG